MSIFKDCDIRGIYGQELTEEDGWRVGRALATMIGGGAVCVGGDVRLSTPVLKAQVTCGLLAGGARVIDLGQVATPMMYFAQRHLGAACGVMVTASHNPAQYNGIKFMLGAEPVTRAQMDQLEDIINRQAYRAGEGTLQRADILDDYIASLAARFGGNEKNLKVVVDAGNGAMSLIAPKALRACGYEVVELYCEPDGRFPNRTPNPAEYEKLTALATLVAQQRADFGVAFDGDGDRAVFCDDQGQVVINDRVLVLFIRYLLKDKPSPVVYDQKSSSVVKQAILQMGGTPMAERSGHTFIKRRFLAHGAQLAGEVSGHFFFGELGYDDGLFAALTLGEALGYFHERLSQALSDVICPPITPDERIYCPYARQDEVLQAVERAFPYADVSHMDGVRVELTKGWALVRKSVTAEQMTIRAEGEDQAALDAIMAQLQSAHPLLANVGEHR